MTSEPNKSDRRIGDWSSWSAAVVLLFLLPVSVICSVVLVAPLMLWWPGVYWVVVVYFALGFLAFIPGVEDTVWGLMVRGPREPHSHERVRIDAAWSRVIERSERTDGSRYRLLVIESDEVNAMAGGGHQIFVTTAALQSMDDDMLPGLLAHELGHHVGLHPIVCALEVWFMRPIFGAQYVAVGLSNLSARIAGFFSGGILGFVVVVLAILLRAVAWILKAIIWIAFAVLRFTGRGAEYRADRYAAQIGFGPELIRCFEAFSHYEHQADTAHGQSLAEIISSTHPPTEKRLLRLRSYLS